MPMESIETQEPPASQQILGAEELEEVAGGTDVRVFVSFAFYF
jgi:hypothetical protein